MGWEIFYSPKAANDLRKLDKSVKIQVKKKIEKLSFNPELGKSLRNIYKNKRSLHVGKLRILYSFNSNQIIIARIRHRKTAYKK